MNKYWVRNKTGRPFNYCGYVINTTGSMLLNQDEVNGLGHYIHKRDIEVLGVEEGIVKSQVVKSDEMSMKKNKKIKRRSDK